MGKRFNNSVYLVLSLMLPAAILKLNVNAVNILLKTCTKSVKIECNYGLVNCYKTGCKLTPNNRSSIKVTAFCDFKEVTNDMMVNFDTFCR